MSTNSPQHRSSRSSTGAFSQQPTLLTTASTQPSSPNNASSPSTPNLTPGPPPVAADALGRAIAQRQSASSNTGNIANNGVPLSLGNTPAQGGAPAPVPPLSSVPCKSPSSKVVKAIREFRNRLLGHEVLDFKGTTVEELRQAMRRIQKDQEDRRALVNMRRMQGCIEAMDNFGKVIEVFLNVSEAVAFIWGPMKFLLLVSQHCAC